MKINHQLTFLMKITKNAIYRLVSKLEPKARTKAAVFFIAAQFIVHQAIADELKESAFSNYKSLKLAQVLFPPGLSHKSVKTNFWSQKNQDSFDE